MRAWQGVRSLVVAGADRRRSAHARRTHPPQAWEKQYLAKPAMQFDADKLDAKNLQHIYFSKEGSAGGYGVGGGGCGCN